MTCSCLDLTRPDLACVSLPDVTKWMTAAPGLSPAPQTRKGMQNRVPKTDCPAAHMEPDPSPSDEAVFGGGAFRR